jgi:hypothetical protein
VMKMSSFTKFYKQWSTSGMKLTGENRQLGEKPAPVPLCPPQISHGFHLWSNPCLRSERPATKRLSHGTANKEQLLTTEQNKFYVYIDYETIQLSVCCLTNLHSTNNQTKVCGCMVKN